MAWSTFEEQEQRLHHRHPNNDNQPMDSSKPPPPASLEDCILQRHSCRAFKPDPVPESLLRECLELAQHAPSNSNIQNWRLAIACTPAAREAATLPLRTASQHADPDPATFRLPPAFQPYRDALVQRIYGADGYDVLGEAAGRRAARQAKRRLQYDFFGAPAVAVLSMDAALGPADALSVGLFAQNLALALTARGLASCLQVSVTAFPEALREGFGIDERQTLLCGMAIGWPEREARVNGLGIGRDEVERQVRFL